MNDLKSKLPDLNELGSMASKLYKDMKTSVCGIIDEYKKNHPTDVKEDVTPKAKKPAAKADAKKKDE